MSEGHLSPDTLTAFAHGHLDGTRYEEAERHVLECDTCCEALRSIDVSISVRGFLDDGVRETEHLQSSTYADDSSNHGRFLPGQVISNRYRIVSLLGVGGMGEVYRADDLKLGQPVALKFLSNQFATSHHALERLRVEVRMARNILHPNVCRVYDIGESDGHHFLSMEYIDGEDLKSLLQRIGRLPRDKGFEISRQLCAGLQAAHQQGILHRDLKPANIMIDGRGQVRITDFGLAMLADAAHADIAGTPAYMAPEQIATGANSVQSDLYALGLVLAEVFSGERVVKASTVQEVRRLQASSASLKLSHDIEPEIRDVVLRCLSDEPGERPVSVTEVLSSLPHSDPLAAAIAAGETPSPELLAANAWLARSVNLHVTKTCLALLLAGITVLLLVPLSNGSHQTSGFPFEPAILRHKARDIVAASGYFGTTVPSWNHEAHGFLTNHDFHSIDTVDLETPSLVRGQDQHHYWYRLHRSPLVAERRLSTRVSFDDPPPFRPGMIELRTDLRGRLIDFHAAPNSFVRSDRDPINWTEFFTRERLGMDFSTFTETAVNWTPQSAYDQLKTWKQSGVDEDRAMYIYAATYRGQLVACRIMWPGEEVQSAQTKKPIMDTTRLAIVVLLGIAIVLAPLNVRRGKSDRQGAARIAMCSIVLSMLGWLFGASFTGYLAYDSQTFLSGLQSAVFAGGMMWCFYLALEPFVRRFWPTTLITWTRMLRCQLWDPEVGRDILVGVTVGVLCHVVAKLAQQAALLLGFSPGLFVEVDPDVLLGPREAIASIFDCWLFALGDGLFLLMFLFAVRLPLRAKGIATVLFVAFFTVQFSLFSPEYALIHLLFWSAAAVLMTRFGLVALICFQFVRHAIEAFPISADFSKWYAAYSLVPLTIIAALGVFGFYVSTLRRRGSVYAIN